MDLYCDTRSECRANRFGAIRQVDHIHQEIEFNALPSSLDALLDSKQFSEFSAGGRENVSRRRVPLQRHIVGRKWNWSDEGCASLAGVTGPRPYSIVRFELKPHGSGTRLVLDHMVFRRAYTTILLRMGRELLVAA